MSAWRRRPSRSICLALLLALIILVSAGASAVIVIISDNQKVEKWKVQPSVFLAVLSSVVNVSLATVLSISVAVCWWRTASHGAKAATMHYIWKRGMDFSIFSALSAGFDVNKVIAVTAIVAIAKFINNPLLQRASGIQTQDIVGENMSLDLVRKLPDGWMGIQSDNSPGNFITSADSLSVVQRWWRN